MKIKGEYRDVLSRNGVVIKDTGWKSNAIVADYGRFLAALMKKDFKQKVGIDYMAVGSGSSNSAVFRDNVIRFIDECLYLFSIDVRFEKDLNNEEGNISEKLKGEFYTKKNIKLSNDAKIIKRKENEWVITDGKISYIVKKEDEELNIGLGPLEVGEKGKKGYYWVWAKEIEDSNIKYLDLDEEGNEVEVIDKRITNRLKIDVKFGNEEPSEEPLEFKEFALLGIDKNSDGTFDTEKMFFINYVDHGVITKDDSMVLTRTVILKFPIEKEVEVSCANSIG